MVPSKAHFLLAAVLPTRGYGALQERVPRGPRSHVVACAVVARPSLALLLLFIVTLSTANHADITVTPSTVTTDAIGSAPPAHDRPPGLATTSSAVPAASEQSVAERPVDESHIINTAAIVFSKTTAVASASVASATAHPKWLQWPAPPWSAPRCPGRHPRARPALPQSVPFPSSPTQSSNCPVQLRQPAPPPPAPPPRRP